MNYEVDTTERVSRLGTCKLVTSVAKGRREDRTSPTATVRLNARAKRRCKILIGLGLWKGTTGIPALLTAPSVYDSEVPKVFSTLWKLPGIDYSFTPMVSSPTTTPDPKAMTCI
jgi:hypothetical protein